MAPLVRAVFLLYISLATGCQPNNSVADPDTVWRICDGLDLTRAILDACGQNPRKSHNRNTAAPCHSRTRRDLTVTPDTWMLYLERLWTEDKKEVQGSRRLTQEVNQLESTSKVGNQQLSQGVSRIGNKQNTSSERASHGPTKLKALRRRTQAGTRSKRSSSRSHWIRVLKRLHEKCCTKGCVEQDLIQFC